MLCYSYVLRFFNVVLGIVVKQENTTVRDRSVKVLVSNHVSPCDHIAVHLACGNITVSAFPQSILSETAGDVILNTEVLEVSSTCLTIPTLCAIVCNSTGLI